MVEARAGLSILFLTPQLPYPPRQGASLRNYNLLRYLAEHHRLSLLSFAAPDTPPEHLAHLQCLCRAVRTVPPPQRSTAHRLWALVTSTWPDMAWRLRSPAYERALAAWLEDEPFDAVQVGGIEMARYLWQLERPGRPRPLAVFDDYNAEWLLQKRACLTDARQPRRWPAAGYSLLQWLKLRRFERQACRRASHVLAVSAPDARALAGLVPGLQPTVVPNGVDLQAYHPGLPPLAGMAHPSLVFTGKMDFRPNVDAVLWFAAEVLPRLWARQPGIHLYVVGQSPSPRLRALPADPRIVVTGWVEDTRPYIAGADVYVVPMRVGGGTRLKVLEAMAMGQAMVSTPLGVEGLGVTDGQEALLAEEPEGFAGHILALLAEPDRRRALGQAARRFVEQSYGWEAIGPKLEAVYGQGASPSHGH